MSKIYGKETKPEILVRKYLFSQGFRYRKNVKGLAGKPDIVLPKYKTVIFIQGCFWHGHKGCKSSKLPETNIEFWEKKIGDNIKRDKSTIKKLVESGWNTVIIWQCQLKNENSKLKTFESLVKKIKSNI